jgi:hypothetical protein
MVCGANVRRGVVDLAGRKTAFAITGQTGAYGRDSFEIFFDPHSPERFIVKEERVVVGHTAYRFAIDPAGDAITLTPLEGRFEPRANLDLGARAPRFTLTDLDGNNALATLYRVDRYPTTFLLDRKGRVIDHDARGE